MINFFFGIKLFSFLKKKGLMYDLLYLCGGFNDFNQQDQELFDKLKKITHKLLVGVYDDQTLRLVKKLNSQEHQPLDVRMRRVKEEADQVFIVNSQDPTLTLRMIHEPKQNQNCGYVILDDNYYFQGYEYVSANMIICRF